MLRTSILLSFFLFFTTLASSQTCTPDIDPYTGEYLNCYYDFSNPQMPGHVVISQNLGGCHIQNSSTSFTFSNTEITINGNAHFDFNVTFDNVIINMTEGSTITVDCIPYMFGDLGMLPDEINDNIPANVFRMINGSEIRACDKLWNGIRSETQENKAGPLISISNSIIRDAYIAIKTSARTNHTIINSEFIDNYIGIDSKFFRTLKIGGSTFKGENGLAPSFSGLNLDSNTSKYGINTGFIRGDGSTWWNIFISSNTFENLQMGIRNGMDGFSAEKFVVEDQVFNNVTIAVQVKDVGYLEVNDNTINYNNIGLDVVESDPLSEINIGTSGSNEFKCEISGFGYASIAINNSPQLNTLIIVDNLLEASGNVVSGIALNNVQSNVFQIRNNDISDSFLGISMNNIRNTGTSGFNLRDNIITVSTNELFRGIYGIGVDNIDFIENTITDNNTSYQSYNGINLAGNSSNNLLTGNTITAVDMENAIHLQQSSMNNLCCNIAQGQEKGVHVEGTNTQTQMRRTDFTSNDLRLTQSHIGDQVHNGNRWKGTNTKGILNSVNLTQAVLNNTFFINSLQSNSTDGRIKPEFYDPPFIEDDWFRDDFLNSSNIVCGNPLTTNCEFPIKPLSPPLNNGNFTFISCVLGDKDTDGDGICDSSDPDPNDACSPNNLDTDGDGVCDGIDPDPVNGCIPFSQDTDGDGVCDILDVAVLNPCIPNGVDGDQDGVCIRFDPDDSNFNIPSQSTVAPSVEKDIKDNFYISSSIINGTPTRTLEQIRSLLTSNFGTHEYELVNKWENDFNLIKFLYENQYYVNISDDLTTFWNDRTNNNDAWQYARIYMNIRKYKALKHANEKDFIINKLYMNRISRMIDHYRSINDSISVSSLSDSYRSFAKSNDDIIDLNETENITAYNQLNQDISSLSEYEIFHSVMKQVMHLELKNLNSGLDQSDLNTLSSLAYMCPLSHGAGVYMAQALLLQYNALDLYLLDDNCDTDFSSLRDKTEEIAIFEAEVYPNPTTGIFSIRSSIPEYKLIIYQNGKEVKSTVDKNVIDLSEHPNGIYQLKFISDNEVIIKQIVKVK